MKKIIWFGLFLLAGCATTYRDFKLSDRKKGEGVAVGRVTVIYNGKPLNSECSVCLNSVNGPCQNLTPEGYVFRNLPQGEASLRRVACKDTSMHHYNIEGATFNVAADLSYFGDVKIEWKNRGGFKTSSMFGLIGAIVDESNNDGAIRMTVSEGDSRGILQAFTNQVRDNSLKATRSLMKEGK